MDMTTIEAPHLEFELPSSHYLEGETIQVVMLPTDGHFEVRLLPLTKSASPCVQLDNNRVCIPGSMPVGAYFINARWRRASHEIWSKWSPPLRFSIHDAKEDLQSIWEQEHRLALMLEKGVGGAITLIDPEAEPPNKAGLASAKWFATPVYEGATPLVNEEKEYYRDPLGYYLECIDALAKAGARFVTWHDVLQGRHGHSDTEILLQFDVDGGPRSMRRIYECLAVRGIRASLMLHRRGHVWYPYELEDMEIDWIRDAEDIGWAIGYHNNALSQIMGTGTGAVDERALDKAAAVFGRDVKELRSYFDIRTFTHHGGNVHNLKVTPPEDLDIVGVDRANAPGLWGDMHSMFSDGGFASRPCSLKQRVRTLISSSTFSASHSRSHLHFFRNHPFKYGNYTPPVDAWPRFTQDFTKAGLDENDTSTLDLLNEQLAKELSWLQQRQKTRTTQRLAYLRVDKPISSRFKPYSELRDRIEELRKRRRSTFLRLYPWTEGDPRVFWWRMLEAWTPRQGELLNVGALPTGQKDEQDRFLPHDVKVKDIDVEWEKSPSFLFDVCNAPQTMNGMFSGIMLFGLPYFASPSKTVAACERMTRHGGVGLFGFVADTHPARGSVWHPKSRHLWRKEKEPLGNIGLKGNLWAFDQDSLPGLFCTWSKFEYEVMGHYWFVVAEKE